MSTQDTDRAENISNGTQRSHKQTTSWENVANNPENSTWRGIIMQWGNQNKKWRQRTTVWTQVTIIYLALSTYDHTINESQVFNAQGATMTNTYLLLNVICRVKYKWNDSISISRYVDRPWRLWHKSKQPYRLNLGHQRTHLTIRWLYKPSKMVKTLHESRHKPSYQPRPFSFNNISHNTNHII